MSLLAIGCGQGRTGIGITPAGSSDAAAADTGQLESGPGAPDVGSGTPDVGLPLLDATAAIDAPAAFDTGNSDTGVVCAEGNHLCAGQCVSNADVARCGPSCIACSAPTGGAARCDSDACVVLCPVGTKLCLGACVPFTTSCGGDCSPGMHLCDDFCVSDKAVASCGVSCTACPVPTNGTVSCDGTRCVAACNAGFHLCAGDCVPNDSVFSCGVSCTACPAPPGGFATCDGLVCGMEMLHPG